MLRLIFRSGLVSLYTLGVGFVLGAGHVVLLAAPRRRLAWRGTLTTLWARGVARIIGMRVRVTGTPPRPPFCLVANHLSYVDVILLMTLVRASFVSKAEVARWPVVGPLARMGGTLFIDRRNKREIVRTNGLIEDALHRGDGVVFFPEGTSTRGDRVYPFKPSLLDVAARREWPVHFAALSYQTPQGAPPAGQAVCWWGDMTFLGHLAGLFRLPSFEAFVVLGGEPVHDADRKALAQRLHDGVEARFTPVSQTDTDARNRDAHREQSVHAPAGD